MKMRVWRVADGRDAGQWRWTLMATNGQIIANSGQAYTKRAHCVRMATLCLPAPERFIVIETKAGRVIKRVHR